MKLDNSIAAVVTGGASGLGRASAQALADAGVKVAIFDLNEEAGVRQAEVGMDHLAGRQVETVPACEGREAPIAHCPFEAQLMV